MAQTYRQYYVQLRAAQDGVCAKVGMKPVLTWPLEIRFMNMFMVTVMAAVVKTVVDASLLGLSDSTLATNLTNVQAGDWTWQDIMI